MLKGPLRPCSSSESETSYRFRCPSVNLTGENRWNSELYPGQRLHGKADNVVAFDARRQRSDEMAFTVRMPVHHKWADLTAQISD
jgi:hypothetical protein